MKEDTALVMLALSGEKVSTQTMNKIKMLVNSSQVINRLQETIEDLTQ
jgi:hypothetical protein